jgi:3-isopropylmalate/(R)-2-methylmalate dehydratase small subunit
VRAPDGPAAGREPFTRVVSAAIVIAHNDIDTDRIIPARYLKAVGREGFGELLFADWRHAEDGSSRPASALDRPEAAGWRILVSGHNFGCGSSREHAVWALMAWGFRVVVAGSFADIFTSNALKNGLLPVRVSDERLEALGAMLAADPDAQLTVDLEGQVLGLPDGSEIGFDVDPFARRMLLDGTDELGYLLARGAEIDAYEQRHPAPISTLPR